MTKPLLSVRNLRVNFTTPSGDFEAVKGVSFDVAPGETVAIVGESGSGKSTIASSINRLLAANGRVSDGKIFFEDREVTAISERDMRTLRGAGIGLVPQDPMSNLNPVHTVGAQVAEALQVHGRAGTDKGRARTLELLATVGIPDPENRINQYPHEFSGGMRQRALIAIGLACDPRLLIADEPTSALDVTVQRRILDRLGELTAESGTAVVLITHDLALAAERADRVLVMYRGELVEEGPAREILERPHHEYTRRLVAAVPSFASETLVPNKSRGNTEGLSERPEPIAVIENVGRSYKLRGTARGTEFWAARNVSFSIDRGRTTAIVGESGSGKSTTAKILLGLETASEGTVSVGGKDLSKLRGKDLLAIRRQVQPVFQNPFASLDPRYTIAESVTEPLHVHKVGDRRTRNSRVIELLDHVALPSVLAERYPHELSGGQRQRVAIARALALEPELVVLDEAVSALDVLVQAQILELLVQLQHDLGLSYLFISHDLAVVNMLAHEVHVMKDGRIVESGTPQQIFTTPQDPYTQELLAAIPGSSIAEG